LGGGQLREHALGPAPEVERLLGAIERERALAEQLRELAGGRAAQQIHLKEPLLRVHVALAAQRVLERGAADSRHRLASSSISSGAVRPASTASPLRRGSAARTVR
jgi:hypothetical protein